MNLEDRLSQALRVDAPESSLVDLARELRDAGVTQREIYRLFEQRYVALDVSHPRYDTLLDALDVIWGGPWAKGRGLFPSELTETASPNEPREDPRDE